MTKEIYNIGLEKMNIALAVYDIGIKRKITLWFDDVGRFVVAAGNREYYPTGQERPQRLYVAKIRVESDEGNWAKYAAEQLLFDIDVQMQVHCQRTLH